MSRGGFSVSIPAGLSCGLGFFPYRHSGLGRKRPDNLTGAFFNTDRFALRTVCHTRLVVYFDAPVFQAEGLCRTRFYTHFAGDATDYLILIREDQWRAGIRFLDYSDLEMRWVPVVRVADTAAVANRAVQLGGEVRVEPRPTENGGSVALLVDSSGARVIIQSWTAPTDGQEN